MMQTGDGDGDGACLSGLCLIPSEQDRDIRNVSRCGLRTSGFWDLVAARQGN